MRLCMGNEALAFGALAAGVNVVSGYPGTPSSEVLETVAARVRKHNLTGPHVEWSTNEKAALEVGAGAAFAGARALVTMKQVGLNVASDALMSLPYLGVKGGLVLVVADDPGPISSQTEQDTRQYAAIAKVPVLDPATPEEAFAMVRTAFALSESYGTPVIVRPTTRVCHGTAALDVGLAYTPHEAGGFERGARWVVFPRRAFEGHGEILERLSRVAAEFDTAPYDGFNAMEDTRPNAPSHLGIVAGGISYAYLRDALARMDDDARTARHPDGTPGPLGPLGSPGLPGLPGSPQPLNTLDPLRLLKMGTPFPFPEGRALAFLKGLSEVLVLEELEPVIERELLQLVGKHRLPVRILGKLTGHTTRAGENSIALIAEQVAAFCGVADAPGAPLDISPVPPATPLPALTPPATQAPTLATPATQAPTPPAPAPATQAPAPQALTLTPPATPLPALTSPTAQAPAPAPPPALPPRPPVLCAGCPHRASFYAVKRALRGRRAVFSGDIGCYTLGNALPLDMVDTCVCMGAGLTIPQGMDWAQPDVLHLGFVGDSTFFASGLTGVVNATYNRAKVTLCVLDNSTTAMTGSQPHPGTGIRMASDSAFTAKRDAERALRIPNILRALGMEHVAQVNPFDQQATVEAVRAAVDFNGPSALVFKAPCVTVATPKPQPTVRTETCTNCKSCIRAIGCPALVVRAGQVIIDTALCYGCNLCVGLCPFDAILPAAAIPGGERDDG